MSVTAGLLKAGVSPSIADIAAAAGVARRTVYLHYPTLEQLLIDAQLGLLAQERVDAAIDAADPGGDVETRVIAMIEALCATASRTLPMGRSLIRLTVEHGGSARHARPVRGYRRVAWIERALEPLRGRLKSLEFERLVSALAIVVGWEALIVLEDIRGLDEIAALDAIRWSARTLVRAALRTAPREPAGR